MALSEKRQKEIMRLIDEGGEELTQAMSRGQKATEKHLRIIRREIACFLKTCDDPEELNFFAANWNRDGNEKPIHQLIRNPRVDAGTLLRVYWQSVPEYYYESHRTAAELNNDSDRAVFATLRRIERRFLRSEFGTASVPFDPRPHVKMWGRRSELARPIPDVMYQPIRRRRKGTE